MVQQQHTTIRTQAISTKIVSNQSKKKHEQANKNSMWACRCSGEERESWMLCGGMLESLCATKNQAKGYKGRLEGGKRKRAKKEKR
jgi:hypothetical protein